MSYGYITKGGLDGERIAEWGGNGPITEGRPKMTLERLISTMGLDPNRKVNIPGRGVGYYDDLGNVYGVGAKPKRRYDAITGFEIPSDEPQDGTWSARLDDVAMKRMKEANDQRINTDERADNKLKMLADVRSKGFDIVDGQLVQSDAYKPQPKSMPAAALKLQQDELNAMNGAEGINETLEPFTKQIEKGELPLGAYENIMSNIKNSGWLSGVGVKSDQGSRNFADFNAALSRMRNESLRLNSGVQTEGDAIRAWDELVSNINDPDVVKQRLFSIMKLNERARALRQGNVDTIRANYGHEPMGQQQRPPLSSFER